jgi:uncharacterized membrane protein
MRQASKTMQIATLGLFTAIIFILAFTPIGFIQLPFIKATVIHIPVIIGAVLLGPKRGAVLGFMFGLTSLINNTLAPAVSSFVFSPLIPLPAQSSGSLWALVVCFVPRILVGVVPWFVYMGLRKLTKQRANAACLTATGMVGSLTNTLLVMNMIFFLFRDSYAAAKGIAINAVYSFILGIIAVNGIPEAIAAGIFTASICGVVRVVLKKQSSI